MQSRDWYAAELQQVETERERLRGTDRTLNVARAGLFFGGLILLGLGWVADTNAPAGARLLWWIGWLLIIAFVFVVGIHEQQREKIEALRNRRNVLRRLVSRLDRAWDRLPVWSPPQDLATTRALEAGGVADDLDLFGNGSLMQLVSMAYTGPGLRTLARWITEAAISETGQARAIAAKSLVNDRASRVRFYELAKQAAASAAEPDAFTTWATGDLWLEKRPTLRLWSWLSPALMVALFLCGGLFVRTQAQEPQAFDVSMGLILACIPVVINLIITVGISGPIHSIFARAVNQRGDIAGYVEMFSTGEALPGSPELIARIRDRLVSQPGGATDGMKRLGRIANFVSMRRGGVSYILFMLLQLLALWDVHLLGMLEKWQKELGKFSKDWIDALGELEALQSIAAMHDDYPEWALAEWLPVNSNAMLQATSLAHPLLKDGVRVANDVSIGPAGTLLLVTGSNMSGKSTMLRSLGLNVVLAGAGAPVCAKSFRLPSVELATSIRVRDSVREGVSFYMAELHRLRDVVAHARRTEPLADRKVLYLLDEILQGTNSRERAIAVVQVLRHLVSTGAIGAISTHDLELAEDPELEPLAHVVHFRETIQVTSDGQETMVFDYHMREGVTPTTNALRLLELVGLGATPVPLKPTSSKSQSPPSH